ncbi:MAG: ADP-ribosylation factor-like protein [Candidatus Hodarchaeales archaeon]|jgi:GTPase SAR1 family protein
MSDIPSNKLLLMGLAAAGKSSIYSVVFEGKTPNDVANYSATKNYKRNSHQIIDSDFQIFDLGGQESFLSIFLGEMAEFIFSEVQVLIWVVDVTDSEHVSTSKYYFDMAIEKIEKYSKNAIIFCLFHKMDQLKGDLHPAVTKNMRDYFLISNAKVEIYYFATSIYEKSIFEAIGRVLKEISSRTSSKMTISTSIKAFMETSSSNLLGLAIFTKNGLPIFEEGLELEELLPTANIFHNAYIHFKNSRGESDNFECVVRSDDFQYIFRMVDSSTFLAGLVSKNTPLLDPSQLFEQVEILLKNQDIFKKI